jgi:hypothetical protein
MPHSIASLLDGGCTLYASVANGLDICVIGIDPSHLLVGSGADSYPIVPERAINLE